MTKSELVKKLHEATHLSQGQSLELLSKLGDIITSELLAGGEVPIPGVGKLRVRMQAACTRRNPQTGAPIDIPAYRKVRLSVGEKLKDALKQG
jgi:DNA-binding protein HU-beta